MEDMYTLKSEYHSVYSSIGNPPTKFTREFTGCLDYIWVRKVPSALKVKSLLAPPRNMGPFPNQY
eukprot:gene6778-16574_t